VADVDIKFGADIADLKGKVDEVLGMFGKITAVIAGIGAAAAGGEAFQKFIDKTNELNSEAVKLSKILGITGEAAGTLNTALGDIGSDADTYTNAFLHFNRQLRQNADEMKAMGVDVDALKSGQKDSNQVFQEALAIVGTYKAGINQATAAQTLFGRSIQDVYTLQKLTNEKIAEAAEKNKALNLTITQEGIAATKAYKLAMNDVRDVLSGVEKTIGEAVIPHFTELAQKFAEFGPVIVDGMGSAVQIVITLWDTLGEVVAAAADTIREVLSALFGEAIKDFAQDGPGAMEIFKNAVKVIQIAIQTFGTAARQAFTLLSTTLQVVISYLKTFAAVGVAALSLDFEGAKQAWKDGVAERVQIVKDGIKQMMDLGQQWMSQVDRTANATLGLGGGTAAGQQGKSGSKTANIGKSTGSDPRTSALLALQKAQQAAALRLQLEFLKEAGDIYDDYWKHNLISLDGYFNARAAIEKRANELELDAKRQELADAMDAERKAQGSANSTIKSQDKQKYEAEVLKFKTEQVKIQGQINVLEAQGLDITRKNASERADAERKITDQLANQAIQQAQQKVNSEVAIERGAIAQQQALRQIDAQAAMQMQKDLETRSFEVTRAGLQAKRALIQGTNAQADADRQAVDIQVEAAEQAHQQRLTEIDYQAVLERKKFELEAAQSIQDAWAQSTNQFLNGQKSLWGAFKSFLNSTLASINNMIAQTFAKQIFGSGSSGGGMMGGFLEQIMGSFAGGFASGGTISAGQWGVVGENGPELAFGGAHGATVIPSGIFQSASATRGMSGGSGMAGGQSVVITNNFTVSGPVDSRTQSQIARSVGIGVQNGMRRNG
jgi:hypothetical protein